MTHTCSHEVTGRMLAFGDCGQAVQSVRTILTGS